MLDGGHWLAVVGIGLSREYDLITMLLQCWCCYYYRAFFSPSFVSYHRRQHNVWRNSLMGLSDLAYAQYELRSSVEVLGCRLRCYSEFGSTWPCSSRIARSDPFSFLTVFVSANELPLDGGA